VAVPPITLLNSRMPLFVGDLASVCDESDLIKAFSRFGTVLEVKLMRDPITKRSLLYAFVTMGSPHESAKAIASLDKELLLGRRLK
jgi:polyadenylate-binding protein